MYTCIFKYIQLQYTLNLSSMHSQRRNCLDLYQQKLIIQQNHLPNFVRAEYNNIEVKPKHYMFLRKHLGNNTYTLYVGRTQEAFKLGKIMANSIFYLSKIHYRPQKFSTIKTISKFSKSMLQEFGFRFRNKQKYARSFKIMSYEHSIAIFYKFRFAVTVQSYAIC